ncbi:MAG: hypothetical protein JW727_01005 [Candidatus Aenigmarchaeota archaeon]|nr:hypothetical protein [Candidatus Aenigmarchaeota archaeon]
MSERVFEECLGYLENFPSVLKSLGRDEVIGRGSTYRYLHDGKEHQRILAEEIFVEGLDKLMGDLGLSSTTLNKGRYQELGGTGEYQDVLVVSDFDGVDGFVKGRINPDEGLGGANASLAVVDEKGRLLGSAIIDLEGEDMFYTRGPISQVFRKMGGAASAEPVRSPESIDSLDKVRTFAPGLKSLRKFDRSGQLEETFGGFRDLLRSYGATELDVSGPDYASEIIRGNLDVYLTVGEHFPKMATVGDMVNGSGGVAVELVPSRHQKQRFRPKEITLHGIWPLDDIYNQSTRKTFLAVPNDALYKAVLTEIGKV